MKEKEKIIIIKNSSHGSLLEKPPQNATFKIEFQNTTNRVGNNTWSSQQQQQFKYSKSSTIKSGQRNKIFMPQPNENPTKPKHIKIFISLVG